MSSRIVTESFRVAARRLGSAPGTANLTTRFRVKPPLRPPCLVDLDWHYWYHRTNHQPPAPCILAQRSFTTTSSTPPGAPISAITKTTSFPDPNRPDIFYHLVGSTFAISFLSSPLPSLDSCTIIGWLPATSSSANDVATESNPESESESAGLNDFVENRKFRKVLHEAIKAGLVEGIDDVQTARAVQTQRGWMHINDDRNVPALGRINDPDDIIAMVLVDDGKILPDTYQPMPSYRLCTADGLPQLTTGLGRKLKTILEQRAREEFDLSKSGPQSG